MKIVILAGGFGTRLSEYTDLIPKPMVSIGGKPIIFRIMSHYANFGFTDFIIALGYKGDVIKEYFSNFYTLNSDFTVNLKSGKVSSIDSIPLDWNVSLIDTGQSTMTGGRLLRLKPFLDDDFMLTYGDGLSDVHIPSLIKHHYQGSYLATVTAVRPVARFGELLMRDNIVTAFSEKPQVGQGWINGGYFIFSPKIFSYIDCDSTLLEREPLENLASDNQLSAYRHNGFWQCMDSKRDKDYLEHLHSIGGLKWTDPLNF